MNIDNDSNGARADWTLLIALFTMGILFVGLAIGGALRWHWSDAFVSLLIELGAALVTFAGFFWLTRRIILQPARAKRGKDLDYGGPPLPQVARRWAAYTTCVGIGLAGLAFILASAKVHPVWVSLTIEFGAALMLLTLLAIAEVLVVRFIGIGADYRPKRSGDLCYQDRSPSPVTREWLIDGGILRCGHKPEHIYTEPIIDLDFLPDLSISGLFFPGVMERWHRLRRLFRRDSSI